MFFSNFMFNLKRKNMAVEGLTVSVWFDFCCFAYKVFSEVKDKKNRVLSEYLDSLAVEDFKKGLGAGGEGVGGVHAHWLKDNVNRNWRKYNCWSL